MTVDLQIPGRNMKFMEEHRMKNSAYCTRIVKIENQDLVDATLKKVENEDK